MASGEVMLNVRNESGAHRRIVVIGKDGATGWDQPRFDEALKEPICMAGLVRLPAIDGHAGGLLFSNPDNLTRGDGQDEPGKNRDRRNLTVKLSTDEGRSWPISRVVEPGFSAYSDLAVTGRGTILCFYGRGEKAHFAGERLTVARFNLTWLTADRRGTETPKE